MALIGCRKGEMEIIRMEIGNGLVLK
jgi:hypothetical protein